MTYYGARATATFMERRFELYGAYYEGSSRLESIRDRDGNIIIQSQTTPMQRGHVTMYGGRLDLTDDYSDPRRGFRLDIGRTQTPPADSGPDFYRAGLQCNGLRPRNKKGHLGLQFLQVRCRRETPGTDRSGNYRTGAGPELRFHCQPHPAAILF